MRFDDEEALAAAGLPGWRPGINVKAEGLRGMRSAQRRGGNDWSPPEALPLANAPGVVCGLWEADDDDRGDMLLDSAPAGVDD